MSSSDAAENSISGRFGKAGFGLRAPFSPSARPATIDEYNDLDAPIVRVATGRGPCRLVGKAFNHSTLYWDVVSIAEEGLVTRRVAKAKVHTTPCARCPGGR